MPAASGLPDFVMPIPRGWPACISRERPFEAADRARSGIQGFAKHYQLSGLYHETITTP
jgi:hypothetical protein